MQQISSLHASYRGPALLQIEAHDLGKMKILYAAFRFAIKTSAIQSTAASWKALEAAMYDEALVLERRVPS